MIVDEAYIEYSDMDSLAPLVCQYDNLIVLRTLSKALALAGVRCGAVIASAKLIPLLDAVLAPYALPSPVIASAERALSSAQLAEAFESVNVIVAERDRLRFELDTCNAIERIWPSQANFLFVRFRDLAEIGLCLADAGIAIRTYDNDAVLKNCARITIAAIADNNRLIHAIRSLD